MQKSWVMMTHQTDKKHEEWREAVVHCDQKTIFKWMFLQVMKQLIASSLGARSALVQGHHSFTMFLSSLLFNVISHFMQHFTIIMTDNYTLCHIIWVRSKVYWTDLVQLRYKWWRQQQNVGCVGLFVVVCCLRWCLADCKMYQDRANMLSPFHTYQQDAIEQLQHIRQFCIITFPIYKPEWHTAMTLRLWTLDLLL